MKSTKQQKEEARTMLLNTLSPGDTVYTLCRHRSRSGMYRVLDVYVIRNNAPFRLTWSVAALCEGYDDRHDGARVHGCGMDMGFHMIDTLSRVLFGDGGKLEHRWI